MDSFINKFQNTFLFPLKKGEREFVLLYYIHLYMYNIVADVTRLLMYRNVLLL